MAQDQFKRKLTTISSAGVAGYSRLMGEDEAATVVHPVKHHIEYSIDSIQAPFQQW
jgi:hypothetical protein